MNGAHAGGVDATKTQAAGAPRPAPVTSDTSPVNQDVVAPIPSVPSELLPFGSLQYDLKQLVYNKYFIHDSLIPVTLGDDPGTIYINQAYMGTYIGDHLRAWVALNGRFAGRIHYKVTLAGASVVIGAIEMGFTHRAFALPSINQLTLIKRSTVAVNNQQVWTFEIGPNVPVDGIMRCFWNWPLADEEKDMLPHFVVINNLPPTNAFNSDALPNLNMRVETKAAMDFVTVCEDVSTFAVIADALTAISASRALTGQGLRNYYVSPRGALQTIDQAGSRWNGKTLGEFLGQTKVVVSLDGIYGYNIQSNPLSSETREFHLNLGGFMAANVADDTVVYDGLRVTGPVAGNQSIVLGQQTTAIVSIDQGLLITSHTSHTMLILGDRPTLPVSFKTDIDFEDQIAVEGWMMSSLPGAIIQRLAGVVLVGEVTWFARYTKGHSNGSFPPLSTVGGQQRREPEDAFQVDEYVGSPSGPATVVTPKSYGFFVQESNGNAYYVFPVDVGWSVAANSGRDLSVLFYPANLCYGYPRIGSGSAITSVLSFDQMANISLNPANITFLFSSYLVAPSPTTVVRTPEESVRVVFTQNIPPSVNSEVAFTGYPTTPTITAPALASLAAETLFVFDLQDPINRETLLSVSYNPKYTTFYARIKSSVTTKYAILNYLDGANLIMRNCSLVVTGNTPRLSKTTKFLDRVGTIDTQIRMVRSLEGVYLSRETNTVKSRITLSSVHRHG